MTRTFLSDDDVALMRYRRFYQGFRYTDLAEMFGCSEAAVKSICTYRTRKRASM